MGNITTTSIFTEITLMELRCKQVTWGDSHMKAARMLVSLRVVNFGFWSLLGCSGQTSLYLAVKISFRVVREEIYFVSLFDLHNSCNQRFLQHQYPKNIVTKWSLLGVKKRLPHAQDALLKGFNSKFPTSIPAPFIWESPRVKNIHIA